MRMRTLVIAALVLCAAAHSVRSDDSAMGLNWSRGMYVQEFWQNNAPAYLIANNTARPVTVAIRSKSAVVKSLNIDAYDVAETPAVSHGGAVTFDVKGNRLVETPRAVPAPPNSAAMPGRSDANGPIGTWTGLNYVGAYDADVALTQDHKSYKANKPIQLRMEITNFVGTLIVKQSVEPYYGLSRLLIKKISAPGFIVNKNGDGDYVITAAQNRMPASGVANIVVTASAPKVESPTFVVFDAFYAKQSTTGEAVTRGIWIVPTHSRRVQQVL